MEVTQKALNASGTQEVFDASGTQEVFDATDIQNSSDTNDIDAFYAGDINEDLLVNDIKEALGVNDTSDTQKQIESLEKKIKELRSIQITEQTRARTRTKTQERKIYNFLTETNKFFTIKVEKDYKDKNKRLKLLLQTMKNVGVPQVNSTKEEEGFLFKGYTLNVEETISLQSACSNYFFFLCKFYLLEHLIKVKEVTTLQEWKCHNKNVEMPKALPEKPDGEKKHFNTRVFRYKFNTWLFPEVNLALLKSIEIIEKIENDDTRTVRSLSECPFTKMYNKGRSKLAKVLLLKCNEEAEMKAFCIRQLEQCFKEKRLPQEEEEEKRQKNKRIRELTKNTDESEETPKNKKIRASTENSTDELEEKKFVDATTQCEIEHTVDTYITVSGGDSSQPPKKSKQNATISKSSAALTDEKDVHKDCYNGLGTPEGQKSEYKEDNELPAKKAPEELKEEVPVENADEDLPDLPPEPVVDID